MNKNALIILVFLASIFSYACEDEQSKHFDRSQTLPENGEDLLTLIKNNSDLSKFAKLIEIAGYEKLLSSSQTFTVWAPMNEGLQDIDPATVDKVVAQQIVSNHIARFNNSTAIPSEKLIRMNNQKIHSYSESGTHFGGSPLVSSNTLAGNGILHTISSRIPYHYNLYEYILADENTSKLADFIRSFEEEKFDEDLSIPIDIDDQGRTVYDTITTSYNRLFDDPRYGLGYIGTEDSLYTMIIPTNQAWDEVYARISPYFKTYHDDQALADSIQNLQTSLAILNDLIYREIVEAPAAYDSLLSTSGSILRDPVALFSDTEKQVASNGLIYKANKLNYNNLETWNKYVSIESEYSDLRLPGVNTAVYVRTVDANSIIPVSEMYYLEVWPTTPTAQPAVTFDIPNVISGKYDIYVEFLPAIIDENPNPNDSTKLLFQLSYLGADGKIKNSPVVNTADLVTSGTQKVKMKVFSGFEFPVANFYDNLWIRDYMDGLHGLEDYVVETKLLVKTNVSTPEFNQNRFTRVFRVDRIILESIPN